MVTKVRRNQRLETRVDELYELVEGISDRLDKHIGNHHGRLSTIKQGSAVGAIVSLAYVVIELLRRFAL